MRIYAHIIKDIDFNQLIKTYFFQKRILVVFKFLCNILNSCQFTYK